MKICYMSDLHFEFGGVYTIYDVEKYKNNFDLLILAGDISNWMILKNVLNELERAINKKIIFVPGNHEYYNTSKEYMDQVLENDFKNSLNIKVLNNSTYEFNNVVFIGSTGWWDGSYNGKGQISSHSIYGMNDFRLISDIKKADNGVEWGKKSKIFFETELERFNGKKIVCISHNGPTKKSVHRKYHGNLLNECFCNNWKGLIDKYQPDFWIHGHTHDTIEYKIGNTQFLCNPRGYVSHEVNSLFDVEKTFII